MQAQLNRFRDILTLDGGANENLWFHVFYVMDAATRVERIGATGSLRIFLSTEPWPAVHFDLSIGRTSWPGHIRWASDGLTTTSPARRSVSVQFGTRPLTLMPWAAKLL